MGQRLRQSWCRSGRLCSSFFRLATSRSKYEMRSNTYPVGPVSIASAKFSSRCSSCSRERPPAAVRITRSSRNDTRLCLSARQEQKRARRFLEHGRGGVAEEQLVARPALPPHHDQVVAAFLGLCQDRLVGRDIGAHGGF